MTEARFPVHAQSHFADGFPPAHAARSGAPKTLAGTTIYSEPGAPVIAVQDGQIVQIGDSPELGHFVSLRDAYGNTYTYAQLGSVAALYPVLKPHGAAAAKARAPRSGEAPEPRPSGPATAGTKPSPAPSAGEASGISGLSLEGDHRARVRRFGADRIHHHAAPGRLGACRRCSGRASRRLPAVADLGGDSERVPRGSQRRLPAPAA